MLLPASSFSSQGFNLKGWAVSARNETASQFSWTAYLFQDYDSFLYFYKNIRSGVWHFQFPLTQIYYVHKSLLLFRVPASVILLESALPSIIYFLLCVL